VEVRKNSTVNNQHVGIATAFLDSTELTVKNNYAMSDVRQPSENADKRDSPIDLNSGTRDPSVGNHSHIAPGLRWN
jgi:hypothetical protein